MFFGNTIIAYYFHVLTGMVDYQTRLLALLYCDIIHRRSLKIVQKFEIKARTLYYFLLITTKKKLNEIAAVFPKDTTFFEIVWFSKLTKELKMGRNLFLRLARL